MTLKSGRKNTHIKYMAKGVRRAVSPPPSTPKKINPNFVKV
uniref:Uncharacterized protein n=1 Tax=Lepeophtheirus salmonis TaxID=72036 RepID=A0A0K2V2Q3_LEPSM